MSEHIGYACPRCGGHDLRIHVDALVVHLAGEDKFVIDEVFTDPENNAMCRDCRWDGLRRDLLVVGPEEDDDAQED